MGYSIIFNQLICINEEGMQRQDIERFVYERCCRSPHGADLMVSAFVQALRSYRCSSVCTPFPSALFHRAGDINDKDYQAAKEAVQNLPELHDISLSEPPIKCPASDGVLRHSNPLSDMPLQSLNLLYWLLHSPYHLELVGNPEEELSTVIPPSAQSKCQGNGFNFVSSPDYVLRVQKAATKIVKSHPTEFDIIKASSGSVIAFHGTSAENLHSILRCGLLSLSRTPLQRNGAIFGEGIYFSTDIMVAMSFSKAKEGWDHSFFGENIQYLLVCEIAKGDKFFPVMHGQGLNKTSGSSSVGSELGSVIVVQNSDLVKIRYIFVYAESKVQYGKQVGIGSENSGGIWTSRRMMFSKHDLCKVLIVLYVGLLLALSYFKSFEKHYRRRVPTIWPL